MRAVRCARPRAGPDREPGGGSGMGRHLRPETVIEWSAGWISDFDRARRRKDEWLWDLAELRELDGERACWVYAVSNLRGVWLMSNEEAGLRRASVATAGQAGAYLLGGVATILAVTQPSSPMMMIAMIITLPFAIGSGLVMAAGLGVATLVGVLRVTQVLGSLPARLRSVGDESTVTGPAGARGTPMSTRGRG